MRLAPSSACPKAPSSPGLCAAGGWRGSTAASRSSYTIVYVPYALFPEMAQQDFTDTSFYDALERRGLKVCHASRVLEVVAPDPQIAAALELSPFEPAIYVDSVGTDAPRPPGGVCPELLPGRQQQVFG